MEDLEKMIQEKMDVACPEDKWMWATFYGLMLYVDYVKAVDPTLHSRAIDYVTETSTLRGASFKKI